MANHPSSGSININSVNFRLMVIGQIISILGSALLRFALSLYVLDITGRADIYATLYAFSNLPLLISPVGGAIAERFNRRNLMVLFDFTSSAVIFMYYLSLRLGGTSILLTAAVMMLLSVISSMYEPAVTASIPLLVKEEHLEGANGLVNGVQALSNVAAPLIGGMFYGIFGVRALVFISGTAFFCSAILELFIRIPFHKREFTRPVLPTMAADLKEGFSYVVRNPLILRSMVLAALMNLILTPLFVVGGPVILRVAMKSTDAMYGIGMGTINLATILGALSIGAVAGKMRMDNLYRLLAAITLLILPMALSVTPALISCGFYPSYLLFLACAVPIAMIMTIISIFIVTKVQKETPNENLGKVMAIITAAAQCAAPLGQLVCGFIFQTFSARLFLPALFICIAMALVSLAARHLWAEITVS